MTVTSRTTLKDYALRELGAPLNVIDLDDTQIEDRIDEAIEFFQEYYFDGIEKVYHKYQITSTDMTNKYITLPATIWAINRIFSFTDSNSSGANIFDLQYQLRMNDLRDLTSTSMVYYQQSMSHIALIENLLHKQKQFRFNRLAGKLYLDLNWDANLSADMWIVLDAYTALDPALNAKMWNERLFKKYVVALMKKQWGTNLSKFSNIALPGGVTLDGKAMYDDALTEIKEIEDNIMNQLAPLEFFLG